MLQQIIDDITNNGGWISGSYVRDFMIRGQTNLELIDDIGILIYVKKFPQLTNMFVNKYGVSPENITCSYKEEKIARYKLDVGTFGFDIFVYAQYAYCAAPDVDVNTICWNGKNFVSWFPYYVEGFTIPDIIARCKNMEAVAITEGWLSDINSQKYYEYRIKNLQDKGWTIL